MRSDQERLSDILWVISHLKSEFEPTRYQHDSIYRFGIVKYLEMIGEAARNISAETKQKAPDVEWAKIIAFRNIAVHQYFELDWDVILDIISQDIPALEQQINKLK